MQANRNVLVFPDVQRAAHLVGGGREVFFGAQCDLRDCILVIPWVRLCATKVMAAVVRQHQHACTEWFGTRRNAGLHRQPVIQGHEATP